MKSQSKTPKTGSDSQRHYVTPASNSHRVDPDDFKFEDFEDEIDELEMANELKQLDLFEQKQGITS